MSESWSGLKGVSVAFVCAIGLHVASAHADGCGRSLDYILTSGSDDMRKPQLYQQLYKSCLQTLQLQNVREAFILKSGAIAVLPLDSSVPATAGILAQFCIRFPRLTLRFIMPKERRLVNKVSRVVRLGTSQSASCQSISGRR